MKHTQYDLPFTPLGKRQLARVTNAKLRAWRAHHKDAPEKGIIVAATDSAAARREYMYWSEREGCGATKFIDIRARRAPKDDLAVASGQGFIRLSPLHQ